MTVSTEVNHNEYTGNGVTTSFPYTFRIFHASDLVVTTSDTNGVLRTLTLNTDYTVTGVGSYSGGAVVLPMPLANAWAISIERSLPVVQETDLRNQGKFFAETHEGAFDYLTMLIQQCFGWARLALLKPSFIARYYDARQNRISNLADPVVPQDAVNNRSMRNYVDAAIAGVVGGFGWFIQYGAGAVYRTFQDKMRESVTPLDFGAVGGGTTNDQMAFDALEALPSGTLVDLLGKTYLVDTLPTVHRYINGYLKHSVDGYVYDANPESLVNVGNRNILLGGAGASMPKWVKYRGPQLAYNVIGMGYEALNKNVTGRNCMAFGSGALHEMVDGRYNLAFGLESQYYCNSDDGGVFRGTRNTSFGDNSLRFNVTGASNCAMGRNTSQTVLGNYNTHLGSGAVGGEAPLDLDDSTIVNAAPSTVGQSVVVGTDAGHSLSGGNGQVIAGYKSAYHLKSGSRNVSLGLQAMEEADKLCSYDGKVKSFVSIAGAYTISSGVITITVASNAGVVVGGRVRAALGSHESNYYRVTSLSGSDKILCSTALTSISESGSTTITEIETTTDYGQQTLDCLAIGAFSMQYTEKCTNTLAFGASSLRYLKSGSNMVAAGINAGTNLTSGANSTLMGYGAGRFMQDGSNAVTLNNVSILGANSSVSGDNQIQLGNGATTVYVYGTVQNRSDERDKADLRPTTLEDDFIDGLEAEEGFWDMRDDYVQFCPDAPEAPIMPKAPVHPSERKVTLAGQDSQGIRIYHLDGDPTNPYSRVIETDSTWNGTQQSDGASFDYHVQLAAYQKEYAAYEVKLAQYPNDVAKYENDLVIWEAECERIKQHNARVATGEGRDGSKKRNRRHQWFSFQKVRTLCERIGKDFGGMQDHSINGGCDVGTLGYDEFIPPLTAYMQRRKKEIRALEKVVAEQAETITTLEERLAKLEKLLPENYN